VFIILMLLQWIGGIVMALVVSPRTWIGATPSVHLHVWSAFLLGGIISCPPIVMALRYPGATATRHVIAFAQALWSALLIHLSGGRIETHFHVFGSLAFLAFYRDWRVLITASLVVGVDHFVCGIWWPQSVYGVFVESPYRWIEHVAWVAFEDVFLILSCVRGQGEIREICSRRAVLESANRSLSETEAELRRQKEAAVEASHTKSQFLAVMSHEIRTPLNSILGFTEVLRRGVGSPQEQHNHLDTIESSGRHLLTLINDILDLSKIEAGQMEFRRTTCSPQAVICEVLSTLRVRAQEKCLSLEAEWTSGVPETIHTDPARLRQLLMNVVGNAIKFTEQGGVKLRAHVTPDSPEPRLEIVVHDTGIGIAPESLDDIFAPFRQADGSVTRRFGGTGLGLAISRNLVRKLGGDITVDSELGRGSVFRITVETGPVDKERLLDGPPSEVFASPRRSDSGQAFTHLASAKILLVEDGVSNRELIRLVLEDAGAQLVCVENGQEALAAFARESFDLILMDMQMPVLDGYAATRRLRAQGCTIPIIALTAHAMRGDREKCLAAGCSDYLSKPIDIEELLETVSQTRAVATAAAPTPSEKSAEEEAAAQKTGPWKTTPSIASTLPVDQPQFRSLVENFIAQLNDKLDAMQAACDAADWDEVAEIAHWLKGSGGTMGFACFTEPAERVEKSAKGRSATETVDGINELVSLAERLARPPEGVLQRESGP